MTVGDEGALKIEELVRYDDSGTVMLAPGETLVWSEMAAMRDLFCNPFFVVFVIATTPLLGLGLVVLLIAYLSRRHTRYALTSGRIVKTTGIMARSVDEVELYRVRDTRFDQSFWERLCGVGSITVSSTDETGTIVIEKVYEPRLKREQIRTLAERAKIDRNVRVME